MTRLAIWLVIIVAALAVVWLAAGRHLSLLLDEVVTAPAVSLPVEPLVYDGGGLVIGGRSMTLAETNNLRGTTDAIVDASGQVVFTTGHDSFVMGPLTSPSPSGRPDFYFRPAPNDEVSFTESKSLLPWPTPLQINWLGGSSPLGKQYVYYRLLWKKPSGAQLEMKWRFERDWYSGKGWTEALMMWTSQTGLLTVLIRS